MIEGNRIRQSKKECGNRRAEYRMNHAILRTEPEELAKMTAPGVRKIKPLDSVTKSNITPVFWSKLQVLEARNIGGGMRVRLLCKKI
jgi:hypothetical protein